MNDYIYAKFHQSVQISMDAMQATDYLHQMLSMEVMLHCYQNLTIFACDINESSLDKTPN